MRKRMFISSLLVTGVKKEGSLPNIFDERQDTSVKIIVLDLREKNESYQSNENTSSSKFKKMPKDTWENIKQVTLSVKPNQVTESPIQASPATTIDVYTNIIPKKQQQQQQQQPHLLRKVSSSILSQNNGQYLSPFNNDIMTPPPPPVSPFMLSQPNYYSVMAAAQSIANLASSYNNMFVPGYNPHQQLMSPLLRYNIQEAQPFQQQKQSQPQQQPQQKQPTQIKRKPVQSPQVMASKIDQRIQRKRSSQQFSRQHVLRAMDSPQQAIKKKVSFNDTLKIHNYVHEEENKYSNDDMGVSYSMKDGYNNHMMPMRKYSSNNKLFDCQQQHYMPACFAEEEEENYGNVWRRPTFI